MAKKQTEKKEESVDVLQVREGVIEAYIVGTRPLLCNRLSEKTKHELLLPPKKKNAVEKQTTLKHRPIEEFRASPHRIDRSDAPTYIGIPAASFKRAMMTAALDLPGTKKAQIGRLTWVLGDYVPVFGVPHIHMSPVRSADMNRTPDIRTRAILPEWACKISIRYVEPLMQAQAVVRLLQAAGLYIGVGDWRNEKGSGTFGSFRLVEPNDDDFARIAVAGGRKAQLVAMDRPSPFDDESAELLSWFDGEVNRRQLVGV